MDTKNTAKLFKTYKFLDKKAMVDIKCGKGWDKLVKELCVKLTTTKPPKGFKVTKIFQHVDKLEVYTIKGDNRTRMVVEAIQEVAFDTCNACGNLRELELCAKCKGEESKQLTDDEILKLCEEVPPTDPDANNINNVGRL